MGQVVRINTVRDVNSMAHFHLKCDRCGFSLGSDRIEFPLYGRFAHKLVQSWQTGELWSREEICPVIPPGAYLLGEIVPSDLGLRNW